METIETKLLTVNIPVHIHDHIAALAQEHQTTKTEIVRALLASGVEKAEELMQKEVPFEYEIASETNAG